MSAGGTFERLAQGRDVWNAWAERLLEEKKSLDPDSREMEAWAKRASVDLSGLDWEQLPKDTELLGYIFPGDVSLMHGTIVGLNFESATFGGHVYVMDLTVRGTVNLSSAVFDGECVFQGCRFVGALDLSGAKSAGGWFFNNCAVSDTLHLARIRGAHFAMRSGVLHGRVDMREASISGTVDYERTLFHDDAFFDGMDVREGIGFRRTQFLKSPSFRGISGLGEADFFESEMIGADFRKARLFRASFDGAALLAANFREATLVQASMLNVEFDYRTDFTGAFVEGMSVDRFALEALRDYGGLTVGARMKMNIRDDVAMLRGQYSGFQGWLHLIALVSFLFPYVWFVAVQWGRASFASPTGATIPLWEALARFIYNGGQGWQQGWQFHFSFLLFLVALAYNLLRGVLLRKTKLLELQEHTTGLPAPFSLQANLWGNEPEEDWQPPPMRRDSVVEPNWRQRLAAPITGARWQLLFDLSRYGFYVYFAVALANLLYFSTMDVPIAP